MFERPTQAIMDIFDALMGNRSGSRKRGTHSGEASREPRVNFNEIPNRGRTYGSTRGRGNSSSNTTGNNSPRSPTNAKGGSDGSRPISSERPLRDTNATGRSDSTNWNHSNQGRSQPSDSDRRESQEPQSADNNDQAGHSRDAAALATAFEPLNRSLETFLTSLCKTSERSEKSRMVFRKRKCYKDEFDGCIDTWTEVMKVHFEEEELTERKECRALISKLEGTVLNCVMVKKYYQRDTAEKIFEILLSRFGSVVQGHHR